MKIKLLVTVSVLVIVVACSSKKTSVATAPAVDNSKAELEAAQKMYPAATAESINRGRTLYYSTCTNCHKPYDIRSQPTNEWPGIVERMAKKAEISTEDKNAVLHFVMAVRLSGPGN